MIPSSVINLGDFNIQDLIYEEEHWQTFSIVKTTDDSQYICKSKKDKYESQESQVKMINLIDLLSKLSSPSLVKYVGFNLFNFYLQPKLTIISQYPSNGILSTLLDGISRGISPFEWNGTNNYIILLGIAFGISYLNSQGYSFEKLNPNHIFLNTHYYPEICHYSIIKNSEENDQHLKDDVYYFSLICYKLITNNSQEIDYSQISGEMNRLFFRECLSSDRNERPNMTEVISYILDKPFKELFDVIETDKILSFLDFYGCENPDISFIKSMILLEKSETEDDRNDAIELLKKSAINGSTNAMYKYSLISTDDVESMSYLQMAVDGGNSMAMVQLASICENGPKIDKEKAENLYKMAINLGNSDAMFRYYSMLVNDENSDDDELAVNYLKMAVSKGNSDALYKVGFLVLNDLQKFEGVDKEKAIGFIQKAAYKGNVDALFHLGRFMFSKAENEEERNKAVDFIKKAADEGNVEAMLDYGNRKENDKDIENAIFYFKMAADRGNREAMFKYGYLIEDSDEDEAKRYFKMATEKENHKQSNNTRYCCIQ